MMEPDAVGPMKQLALRSGGKFSVIQKDDSVQEQSLETISE